jgi:hypothetical protein
MTIYSPLRRFSVPISPEPLRPPVHQDRRI